MTFILIWLSVADEDQMFSEFHYQRSDPRKEAQDVARMLSNPTNNNIMRLPTFPGAERTALSFYEILANWGGPPTGSTIDAFKVVLFRDAAFPLWGDQYFPAKGWYSTCFSFMYPNISTFMPTQAGEYEIFTLLPDDIISNISTSGRVNPQWYGISPATPVNLPWTYPLIGQAGSDAVATYVPAGTKLYAYYIGKDAPSGNYPVSLTVMTEQYVSATDSWSRSEIPITVPTGKNAAISAAFGHDDNCFMRIRNVVVKFGSGDAGGFTNVQSYIGFIVSADNITLTARDSLPVSNDWVVTVTGNATPRCMLPLSPLTEIMTTRAPFTDTKVNAVSLSMENTTKVVNQEGTILAGRVPAKAALACGISGLATQHPAEKYYERAADGLTMYCPPDGGMSKFESYMTTTRDAVPIPLPGYSDSLGNQLPLFRIRDDAWACVAFMSDPDGGTTFGVKVRLALEYRTNQSSFRLGIAGTSLESIHRASIACSVAGYFHKYEKGPSAAEFKVLQAFRRTEAPLGGSAKVPPPKPPVPVIPPQPQQQQTKEKKKAPPQHPANWDTMSRSQRRAWNRANIH